MAIAKPNNDLRCETLAVKYFCALFNSTSNCTDVLDSVNIGTRIIGEKKNARKSIKYGLT